MRPICGDHIGIQLGQWVMSKGGVWCSAGLDWMSPFLPWLAIFNLSGSGSQPKQDVVDVSFPAFCSHNNCCLGVQWPTLPGQTPAHRGFGICRSWSCVQFSKAVFEVQWTLEALTSWVFQTATADWFMMCCRITSTKDLWAACYHSSFEYKDRGNSQLHHSTEWTPPLWGHQRYDRVLGLLCSASLLTDINKILFLCHVWT